MKRSLLHRSAIGLDLGGSALKAVIVGIGLAGSGLRRSLVVPVPERGPEIGRAHV